MLQVMISIVGLVVLLPLMALLVAAIKIVSTGPAFYRGERVGKDERLFTIYKFRTLEVGAEQKIGGRLLCNDDPFYHRLGKFLKHSKLDEIPQLLNVIMGHMNLVGPRPVRPVFLSELKTSVPGYCARFAVRPGMTGLAQLRGGYYTRPQNKLRYDKVYITNRSLRLDASILLMTFVKLVQRWITASTLLGALVLIVSFVPAGLIRSFSCRMLGVQFNPLIPAILAAGVYLTLHAGKSNKWLISHSAIDWPAAAFIFLSAIAVPFALNPVTAFRGLVYLCITGFFFAFVLVNLRPDEKFACRASQVLGAVGGAVAALGIVEAIAVRMGFMGGEGRSVSTLGSPLALTAYLALCFPLALCEFLTARSRRSRIAWAVIVAAIGGAVAAAGSRLGVPALLVSAGVMLVKSGRMHLNSMLKIGVACILLLAIAGGRRYRPQAVAGDTVRAGAAAVESIRQSSFQQLLIGYGSRTISQERARPYGPVAKWARNLPESGYLTLLLENGIAGFCLMTWLGALVVREISITARKQSPELRLRLWSLGAAICGLAVAAISFNIFYNMAIQLVFWGLVGLALGLAVRSGGRDPGAVLVMRFGH
ncbi:MAG TPA: sugar transferase [Planctomycetota bacterium]|nr:sugar transferase [Planctomycetota bacterium]